MAEAQWRDNKQNQNQKKKGNKNETWDMDNALQIAGRIRVLNDLLGSSLFLCLSWLLLIIISSASPTNRDGVLKMEVSRAESPNTERKNIANRGK